MQEPHIAAQTACKWPHIAAHNACKWPHSAAHLRPCWSTETDNGENDQREPPSHIDPQFPRPTQAARSASSPSIGRLPSCSSSSEETPGKLVPCDAGGEAAREPERGRAPSSRASGAAARRWEGGGHEEPASGSVGRKGPGRGPPSREEQRQGRVASASSPYVAASALRRRDEREACARGRSRGRCSGHWTPMKTSPMGAAGSTAAVRALDEPHREGRRRGATSRPKPQSKVRSLQRRRRRLTFLSFSLVL